MHVFEEPPAPRPPTTREWWRTVRNLTVGKGARWAIYRAIRQETARTGPHSLGALLVASGAVE